MATELTLKTDLWKESEYKSQGWVFKGKAEIGVDEYNNVLYIDDDGVKIGLDFDDAKRVFNFFLNK